MTVYQIVRQKPGQRPENKTFEISCNSPKTISGEYFKDERDAIICLADWFTRSYFDWLVLEDEDGADKAEKKILDGISAEDGDGVRYYVREFEVPAEDVEDYLAYYEEARLIGVHR